MAKKRIGGRAVYVRKDGTYKGNDEVKHSSAPKLAALVGTEKQIAWAEDIRQNFLNAVTERVEKVKAAAERRGSAMGYPKEEVETAANAVNEYYGLLFNRADKASSIINARYNALSHIYAHSTIEIALERPAKIKKRIEMLKNGEFNEKWLSAGWSIKE